MTKHKHLPKAILALLLAAVFVCAYIWAGSLAIPKKPERSYLVYASCYPVYALSSLILKDVPGIELHQLTQPTARGLGDYALSDWDRAILSRADIVINLGGGYEAFAAELMSGSSICITLQSALPLASVPDEATVYGTGSAEREPVPWLYLSAEGAMELCEALCANMCTADETCANLYIANLNACYDQLSAMQTAAQNTRALRGVNVALMHEALLYTAKDAGANVVYSIDCKDAQALLPQEFLSVIDEMRNAGAQAVLVDRYCDLALIQALEAAGLPVISLDLMCDMNPSYGSQGYFDAFYDNLKAIEAFADE